MNIESDNELNSSYVENYLNAVKSSSRSEEVNRHKNLKKKQSDGDKRKYVGRCEASFKCEKVRGQTVCIAI